MTLNVLALLLRARPMTPAAKQTTASRSMTQAGYAPTLAEKKPLITSEKPLVMGTSFGYVSSSRTSQTIDRPEDDPVPEATGDHACTLGSR